MRDIMLAILIVSLSISAWAQKHQSKPKSDATQRQAESAKPTELAERASDAVVDTAHREPRRNVNDSVLVKDVRNQRDREQGDCPK